MKNVFFVGFVLFVVMISCSKREPTPENNVQELKPHYDTTAIDSFSDGAISVDVARQIRMSSQKYQDSLKEVLKLQEEEKRIQEELEKENKKKAEQEKKDKAVSNQTAENKQE